MLDIKILSIVQGQEVSFNKAAALFGSWPEPTAKEMAMKIGDSQFSIIPRSCLMTTFGMMEMSLFAPSALTDNQCIDLLRKLCDSPNSNATVEKIQQELEKMDDETGFAPFTSKPMGNCAFGIISDLLSETPNTYRAYIHLEYNVAAHNGEDRAIRDTVRYTEFIDTLTLNTEKEDV